MKHGTHFEGDGAVSRHYLALFIDRYWGMGWDGMGSAFIVKALSVVEGEALVHSWNANWG